MKTIILSLLCSVGLISSVSAQLTGEWCGTDYKMEQALLANPNLEQELYQTMLNITAPHPNGSPEATKLVPVVVHILHDDGIGNISYAQIQDALDILNIDYNRLNADTADTRNTADAPFKPHAASMDIEFRLARIDPSGNCTNGVVRKNVIDAATYDVDMNSEPHKHSSSGGSDAWPRNKYFNIWVINSIEGSSPGLITGGYAQFPYFGAANEYGVVVRNDYFGSIETAQGQDGGVLTHELGHCLGLYHIFQEGCHVNNCNTNGDWCCDTPPQEEAAFNCSPSWNSCTNVPAGGDPYGFDAFDQIENYMSYNTCWNMFSIDQAAIMDAVFTDFSWASQLISAGNTAYTGIDVPNVLCQADFSANQTTICAGETIDFTDETFNSVNAWDWGFPGGTPAISTSQNPSIVYNTPGLYEVSLDATDGANTDLETKTFYIRVLPSPHWIPFLEDFEGLTTLVDVPQWEVIDWGNNAEFELVYGAGQNSMQCAKLANFDQPAGNFDELTSRPVDLSSITSGSGMTLSFRYAYRKRTSANDEWLKVYVSNDCGESWVPRKTLHGDLLGTATASSTWTPSSAADWITVHTTNITSAYWVNNFRYKFEFESDGGNNFYLDNINIYSGSPSQTLVVGVEEQADLGRLTLFPNPTDSELNVRFDAGSAQQMEFYIQDLSGKIVKTIVIQAAVGANLVVLGTDELASGMYFLNIDANGTQQAIQFVVK